MKRVIFSVICLMLITAVSGCNEGVLSESSADSGRFSNNTENSPTVIAYYFHRTVRCPTCLAIESNSADTIEENFSQQIDDGTMVWMPFNLDGKGGAEFKKQFDVSAIALVVAKMQDGKVVEYKKLEKVWQLVRDKQAFSEYVTSEINEYMHGK